MKYTLMTAFALIVLAACSSSPDPTPAADASTPDAAVDAADAADAADAGCVPAGGDCSGANETKCCDHAICTISSNGTSACE